MSLLAGCKCGLENLVICSPKSVKLGGTRGSGAVVGQVPSSLSGNGVARLSSRAGWKLFSAVA